MNTPTIEMTIRDCPTDNGADRVRLFARLGKELVLLANPASQCPPDDALMKAAIALQQCLRDAETDPVAPGECCVAAAVAFIAHQFTSTADDLDNGQRAALIAEPVLVFEAAEQADLRGGA